MYINTAISTNTVGNSNDIFCLSINKLSFIALCWVVYRANKSIGEKGCNKEKLLKILNYENKPVKIKLWMHAKVDVYMNIPYINFCPPCDFISTIAPTK